MKLTKTFTIEEDIDLYFLCREIEDKTKTERFKELKQLDNEFTDEIMKENPEWAKNRRCEYLKDRIIYLMDFLPDSKPEMKVLMKELGEWKKKKFEYKPEKLTEIDIENARNVKIELVLGEPKMRGGGRLKYCCPLHEEKDPSFTVYERNNSWFCFGCNKGGDVINLIKELENCDFKEAVKILCNT